MLIEWFPRQRKKKHASISIPVDTCLQVGLTRFSNPTVSRPRKYLEYIGVKYFARYHLERWCFIVGSKRRCNDISKISTVNSEFYIEFQFTGQFWIYRYIARYIGRSLNKSRYRFVESFR